MSVQTAGYRIGVWFLGTVALLSLLALPIAYSQCAECAGHPRFANNWSPEMTPVSVALFDWPSEFGFLLMASVAAVLCFVAVAIMLRLAKAWADLPPTGWRFAAQAVLSSFVVGVLNFVGAYASGCIGYVGPANGLWLMGIPAAVAVMNSPNKWAVFWIIPLFIGGWITTAIIGMTVGIPLD